MCFTGLIADSDEGIDDAACHFVVERKKVWFLDRGREDFSDLFKHTFVFVVFCGGRVLVSLIVGVVIIFGIHPAVLPSLSYTLWFGRFLQGFKGKLMHVVLFFCLFFNSWYLLVFLAFQT